MFNSSWGVDFTELVGLKSGRDIKSRMDHRRMQEARDRPILRAFIGTWLFMALSVGVLGQSMPPSGRISDFRDPNVDAEDGWTVLFNGKDFAGWVPVLKQQEGVKKYLEARSGSADNLHSQGRKDFDVGKTQRLSAHRSCL